MLKMNELERRSDTPKSTILYYVKEGLLPQPQRPKPNFHLYDESCVATIEFIKYLQLNFSCSIAQIKALFASAEFDPSSPYESLLSNLELIMGAGLAQIYSSAQLCAEFGIDQSELNGYVNDGLLAPRDAKFTAKEREILAIILNADQNERALIAKYLQAAKQLAALEIKLTLETLKNTPAADKNHALKQLFDILLVLKPYLLNMQTLAAYQKEKK